MIYSLTGKLQIVGSRHIIVLCGGVGFKLFVSEPTLSTLPPVGNEVTLFCFLFNRDDQFELYGFPSEASLKLFELLNTVSGIGPKTALGILEIDSVPNIIAAIVQKRADMITRTSGIGRKTAERVILELHNKLELDSAKTVTERMDSDHEVEEALVGLGYARRRVRDILDGLDHAPSTVEEKLKLVLKELGRGL